MKIAYFDCFSGAAGDMIAGAMLDAGLDFEFLKSQIATLGLKNLDITVSETRRAGLRAKHFVPLIKEEHHHRHLGDIKKIINDSKIGEKPKQTAIAIFGRLAQAEATVHGKNPDDIHFHEVGAMDSIVDIVSAAIGFDALGIEKVYCSTLAVGGGQVKAAHGIMPVPAPATAELLKGIPTVGGPIDKELLTPTGAAILTTLAESFGPIPPMTIEATGYGAGTLDSEHVPNVVRLILGRSAEESSATTDRVCLIETNIDDSTGEIIANVMDKLLSAGALDVFTTPIVMKQTRPAVKLTVICQTADIAKMEEIIFQSGITFGVRRQIVERSKLAREFVTVTTGFGNIKIKVGRWADKVVNAKPEFADCAKAAQEHNTSVKEVMQAAIAEFKKAR
ncbi:MAG: nickel pincer cofactor biosynthesis protein LarC [Sedimentisphaerales bacterium]